MATHYNIAKLTEQQWLNLFDVEYTAKDRALHHWLMCSRKDRPVEEAGVPDAAVIVAILPTPEGDRLLRNFLRATPPGRRS